MPNLPSFGEGLWEVEPIGKFYMEFDQMLLQRVFGEVESSKN